MKKAILFSVLFLSAGLFGCSNNSLEPDSNPDPEPEVPIDSISGIYFLHGEKIQLRYDFPWPSWGGEEVILSRDTTRIAFTVAIQMVEDKQDTVQFFGLESVNAGWSIFPPDCTELYIYCAYAKYTDHILEFDFSSPDGTYLGTGTLADSSLTINSHFEYRDIGIDYDLQGIRIDE